MTAETPSTAETATGGQMSLLGAVFLGVGAMVGAGIFALLGEAGALAGSATWLSFLLGAVIALLLGYTISKLSARYPSRGGLMSYVHQSFGDSHLAGTASWLFYIAGLIVTAMVALSFGSYARALFLPDDASLAWVKVFATVAIVGMAFVFVLGPAVVSRMQSVIVFVLLAVFAVFIVVTLSDLDPDLVAFSTYPSMADVVAAIALTFFAYLGFAVVATTAESIADPARNVARATYLALVIAGSLYVLISLGVYGTLTVPEVIAAGDTALAEAAEPSLGQAGYSMMAIAALLATASSVSANLFAFGNLVSSLAETREFPPVFGRKAPVLGTAGVVITVGLVVAMALFFDLSTIASVGSAVALVIFALVGVGGIRLRRETGSNLPVLVAAVLSTLVVFVMFAVDTARNEPRTFVAMILAGVIAVVLDFSWKARRDRAVPTPP